VIEGVAFSMFGHPAWRRKPLRTAARTAKFLLRRSLTPGAEISILLKDGRIRLVLPKRSQLAFVISAYGSEDPDIALVRQLLHEGEAFVDGGAHIGLFTLTAAVCVGQSGQVLAFEPAPQTRRVLENHVRINHLRNVLVNPCALAESAGARTFAAFTGEMWGYSSFAPPQTQENPESVTVEVTTLDAAIFADLAPRIRLIKLDLEGAEFAALTGAKNILSQFTPDLLLEIEASHLERQGASIAQVTDLLASYGYQTFRAEWTANHRISLVPAMLYEPDPLRPNFLATARPERLKERGIVLP
jgi:FkbM family methyltransferase